MLPENINKYLYIRKVPTWLIRTIYLLGILTWLPILVDAFLSAGTDPFLTWVVTPIICILSVHYFSSFILVLFYKKFSIEDHRRLVADYWTDRSAPTVDVYLPICGEGMDILRHTWTYVAKLDYPKMKVYVLDDSKEETAEHEAMAKEFGFEYIERPNKGEMKKAGNLKYAYLRTKGDIIAILDADFAPHQDFLHDLVPYMNNPKNGIIQSPQYFPTSKETHDKGPLAFGGARAQEIFYRIIQVARDQLGGAHCCGTCALYRREALDSIGGFVQMSHSEDAHTGFGLTSAGWNIKYVPVILSVGDSPNDAHAFFHQQHRWCLGNLMMMCSKKFWQAKIPWRIKFCYATGFLFYAHQVFVILISFQLFWTLFFYNQHVSWEAGYIFYPHTIWSLGFIFFFYLSPLRWGYLYAICMRSYAYCHAAATMILGGTVGWIPTNAKHAGVSAAFRQAIIGVSLYVLVNICLIALAVRYKVFHPLDYNYFSVQFWIFYNTGLATLVLWQMYQTMSKAQLNLLKAKTTNQSVTNNLWQLKTGGAYTFLVVGLFLGISYPAFTSQLSNQNNLATHIEPIKISEPTVIESAPSQFVFNSDRRWGDQGEDIVELQRFLNDHGFILTDIGPGSPGNETEFFGPYTHAALVKFQLANNLDGSGFFGPQTREIINLNFN